MIANLKYVVIAHKMELKNSSLDIRISNWRLAKVFKIYLVVGSYEA